MTSPLPPKRRDSRNLADLLRQDRTRLTQLDRGLMGGRAPMLRPVKPRWTDDEEDDTEPDDSPAFQNTDRVIVSTPGIVTLNLTYEPIPGSLHVYWGTLDQPPTEWVLNGQAVTFAEPHLKVGNVVTAAYAYYPTEAEAPLTFATYMASLLPAWWDRLGETSGPTAIDSSGNNRNGTVTGASFGATGLVTGDPDTAATWVAPARITVPYDVTWMDSPLISGFILFKTTNTDLNGLCFMSRWDSSVAQLWSFDHVNGNIRLRLNTATVATTGLALNDGGKHMAGFTYDGTTVNLYTEAGLVKTQTVTGATYSAANVLLATGADYGGGGGSLLHHFAGTLDEPAYQTGTIWTPTNFATLWALS